MRASSHVVGAQRDCRTDTHLRLDFCRTVSSKACESATEICIHVKMAKDSATALRVFLGMACRYTVQRPELLPTPRHSFVALGLPRSAQCPCKERTMNSNRTCAFLHCSNFALPAARFAEGSRTSAICSETRFRCPSRMPEQHACPMVAYGATWPTRPTVKLRCP